MKYPIRFADSVLEHPRWLRVAERSRVLEGIQESLVHEPTLETHHRKPLRPNPLAPWELRFGNLRVFWEVAPDDPRVVRILASGRKQRGALWIGGKEITH